ncbi:MAG: chromosome partitioning protein ParB [Lentisphaerae bacterium]|nr:chromosome partitioning protein ParB [Lentisphaerota bacterium]
MLTTKRYEYLAFDAIRFHPSIENHRALRWEKVQHYEADILKNGLLEPLVVWERNPGEFYLVGGFHRHSAIRAIRAKNPGYFDRVDVRVVAGDPDEIRALNLKLNADRLDTRITDYFDTIVYLNNANWPTEKIAAFLDRREAWVGEILRYAPGMDPRLRVLLGEGRVSWNRARDICREALAAAPGREKEAVDRALAELESGRPAPRPARLLTPRRAARRLARELPERSGETLKVRYDDLLALVNVMAGLDPDGGHAEAVRRAFPGLLPDEASAD